MSPKILGALLIGATALAGCADKHAPPPGASASAAATPRPPTRGYFKVGAPYTINGITYTPKADLNYDETGIASWYGEETPGPFTANGEPFDPNQITGAHKTLPLPCLVRVTNLDNGRALLVRVNDRGPFVNGRIIDLSRRGAQLLGYAGGGTAKVRVQVLPKESQALEEAARHGQIVTDIASLGPLGAPAVAGAERPTPTPVPEAPREVASAAAAPPPPPVAAVPLPPVARPATKQPDAIEALLDKPAAQLAPTPQIAPEQAPIGPRPKAPAPEPPPPAAVAGTDEIASLVQATGKTPKGQDVGGRFLPAPVVQQRAVPQSANIYVQAGAFPQRGAAEAMRGRVGSLGQAQIVAVTFGPKTLYRVRVGPVATVDQADQLLAKMQRAGVEAPEITVD